MESYEIICNSMEKSMKYIAYTDVHCTVYISVLPFRTTKYELEPLIFLLLLKKWYTFLIKIF